MFRLLFVFGGLGNTLFQYQKAYNLAINGKALLSVNLESGEVRRWSQKGSVSCFNVNTNFVKLLRLLRRGLRMFSITKKDDKVYFGVIYDGYWQDTKNVLDKDFFRREGLLNLSNLDKYSSYVFLHIRGGDYLHGVNRKIYHQLDKEYFRRSLEHLNCKNLAILTNDIAHAKTILVRLKLSKEWNVIWPTEDPLDVMYSCKGGVCSNSTFSWWISALGDGEYILPSKWYHSKVCLINYKYRDNIWIV